MNVDTHYRPTRRSIFCGALWNRPDGSLRGTNETTTDVLRVTCRECLERIRVCAGNAIWRQDREPK